MPKVIFTHTMPDGSLATRKSHYAYKFIIIGRRSRAKIRELHGKTPDKHWFAEFKHYSAIVNAGVGGVYGSRQYGVNEFDYNRALERLGGAKTKEEYGASRNARIMAAIDKEFEEKTHGPWEALAWSTKLEFAVRRASSFSTNYDDIQVCQISSVSGQS
jgi:hypothetical protein